MSTEAKRLALLLAEHAVGTTPETFALLALMYLHAALLEEQDRVHWDQQLNRAVAVAQWRGPHRGTRRARGIRAAGMACGLLHVGRPCSQICVGKLGVTNSRSAIGTQQ